MLQRAPYMIGTGSMFEEKGEVLGMFEEKGEVLVWKWQCHGTAGLRGVLFLRSRYGSGYTRKIMHDVPSLSSFAIASQLPILYHQEIQRKQQ